MVLLIHNAINAIGARALRRLDDVSAAVESVSRTRAKAVVGGPGTHSHLQDHASSALCFVRVRELWSMTDFECSKRVVLARIAQFARIETALSVHTTRTPSLVPQNERQRELQHR